MSKKIYFLSGAAATGKTKVFEALQTLLKENTLFQGSVTRDYYKKVNILNELTLKDLSNEEKLTFQLGLFEFYLYFILDKIKQAKETTIIIDRAPFDVLSWTIYACPTLNISQHFKMMNQNKEFFKELSVLGTTTVCEFPYPCPWTSITGESSDGFRFDPHAKNQVISHTLNREINDHFSITDHPNIKHKKIPTNKATVLTSAKQHIYTPLERAQYLLE
jgi:hypothetical protein